MTTKETPKRDTQELSQLRPDDRDIPAKDAERIPRWTLLLVPILAAVVASPGLGNHLLSDDFALLSSNVGQDVADLFSPFFQQSTSRAAGGTYRPLTEVFIGLEAMLWGSSTFGLHLVNLLFHVLNSLLCYGLVRVMVPPRPVVALTAALIFAVHPVHGDAIFWLSARSDLICTFFYLLSMILFVRGRGRHNRRTPTLGSVLCFILALLAKEVALSLPLLVVVLDLAAPSTEGFRTRFRRHLPRYLVYMAVGGAYLGLRLTVLPTIGLARFPGVGAAMYNLFLYLKLLVLPFETQTGPRGLVVVTLGIIVLVVAFLRYARMGDRRNLFLSAAWMMTIIFPMLDMPRRWQLYLPSVGFSIFLAIVMAGLIWRRDDDHPRWLSRSSGLGLLGLLLGGGIILYMHASVYGKAGQLAQNIVEQIKSRVPNPAPGTTITVANLPGVLTSRAGDQPIFAFGLSEALRMAYGRSDISGRLLSTLYVEVSETAAPRAWREQGNGLVFQTGGGASSFSFHDARLTTGRDLPDKDKTYDLGAWLVTIEKVDKLAITRIRVRLKEPVGPIWVWDGKQIVPLPNSPPPG